jgi:hypothetical protein
VTVPLGTICNTRGERVDAMLHSAGTASAAADAVVMVAHGVMLNKDRPWLIAPSKALSETGLELLRISFAGNGESELCYEDATLLEEEGSHRPVRPTLLYGY